MRPVMKQARACPEELIYELRRLIRLFTVK